MPSCLEWELQRYVIEIWAGLVVSLWIICFLCLRCGLVDYFYRNLTCYLNEFWNSANLLPRVRWWSMWHCAATNCIACESWWCVVMMWEACPWYGICNSAFSYCAVAKYLEAILTFSVLFDLDSMIALEMMQYVIVWTNAVLSNARYAISNDG